MAYGKIKNDLQKLFVELKEQGLYKNERILTTPQDAKIGVQGGTNALNFCANNYLGLGNNPEVIKAAQNIMNDWGYGCNSVRFICGTQAIHKQWKKQCPDFWGWKILFSMQLVLMLTEVYLNLY